MNEKNASQPSVSPRQKIALILVGLILSLVLLEGGLRLGGWVLLSLQEYGNARSLKQKDTYRILCLGESTTQGQYPPFLEKALNERNTGVRFSVIDKGIQGTITPVIISRVESFLDEYHPDMVVAMMGINDWGKHMPMEVPSTSKGVLFIRSLKIYKLAKLLELHLLARAEEFKLRKTDEPAKEIPASTPRVEPEGTPNYPRSTEDSSGKVVELDPKNEDTYTGLGRLYQAQGEVSQAEDSFKRLIEINPKNEYVYTQLGQLYQGQGKFAEAEDSFKRLIEIDPQNDHAYAGLGQLYQMQGKFSQAEVLFNKVIELDPENDGAYISLGQLYRARGEFSQVEGLFKKALELNPENKDAYLALGWFYRDQGKLSQAEGCFKQAMDLDPKDYNTYIELSQLYQDQGKLSQVEGLFKKVLGLNPKNDRILGAMSLLYQKTGKPWLAEVYAKKAEQLRGYYNFITMNSYRELKEILDKRKIRLVCVQYPMRDAGPLKQLFAKENDVIVVDNEKVFKDALKKGSYKEYFADMFGGDFGHCTPKGNTLLARNIAERILREAFNKSQDPQTAL